MNANEVRPWIVSRLVDDFKAKDDVPVARHEWETRREWATPDEIAAAARRALRDAQRALRKAEARLSLLEAEEEQFVTTVSRSRRWQDNRWLHALGIGCLVDDESPGG